MARLRLFCAFCMPFYNRTIYNAGFLKEALSMSSVSCNGDSQLEYLLEVDYCYMYSE